MSTITIRADVSRNTNVPQRKPELIIDGVRVNTGPHPFNFEMEQDEIEKAPSIWAAEDWKAKTYMPGIRTYMLSWGDVLVMVTNDEPERRVLDDGMVEWTWRNVALEGQL